MQTAIEAAKAAAKAAKGENNIKANLVYYIDTETGLWFISPNPGEFKRLGNSMYSPQCNHESHPKTTESFLGHPDTCLSPQKTVWFQWYGRYGPNFKGAYNFFKLPIYLPNNNTNKTYLYSYCITNEMLRLNDKVHGQILSDLLLTASQVCSDQYTDHSFNFIDSHLAISLYIYM